MALNPKKMFWSSGSCSQSPVCWQEQQRAGTHSETESGGKNFKSLHASQGQKTLFHAAEAKRNSPVTTEQTSPEPPPRRFGSFEGACAAYNGGFEERLSPLEATKDGPESSATHLDNISSLVAETHEAPSHLAMNWGGGTSAFTRVEDALETLARFLKSRPNPVSRHMDQSASSVTRQSSHGRSTSDAKINNLPEIPARQSGSC